MKELFTVRVAEVQKIYSTAKEALPEKAKSLLEPLEELSSKILFSRKDLKRFLKQWETLQQRIQELRQREGETARRWLDEMYNIQANIRLGDRLHEWQEAYGRLRRALPAGFAAGAALVIGGLLLKRKENAITAQTLCATGVVKLGDKPLDNATVTFTPTGKR